MKKSKMKTAVLTMAVLIAAFTLPACGEQKTETTAKAAQGKESGNAKACESGKTEEGKETIQAGKELSGTIAVNGSTSMESLIGILSEQFMADHPGVTVTYDATGSGTGIEAANNGTCDIGLASRGLKDQEKQKGLKETTVAWDGIALIVNGKSPISDLSMDEIAEIYTGSKTNWSAFGGPDGEIACIGREAGSGTRDGFETITGTGDRCRMSQELTSTGAVIEAVKNSENAIGYASFAAVQGKDGIKVLTVGGVDCTEEKISDGSYVIRRPFNLITKEGRALGEAAQAFFDCMTSADSAALIEKAGAVPVRGR